jgi:peptidoglycan/LPS O-acetylase OafA/YrhL
MGLACTRVCRLPGEIMNELDHRGSSHNRVSYVGWTNPRPAAGEQIEEVGVDDILAQKSAADTSPLNIAVYEQSHLTHPKYRADLDGLRAVAVLLVLGFHAFPSRLSGGFVGVDIFFVISGFLISGIIFDNLKNGSFSYLEFQSRRIRRIFPALLVVLITCLAFGWYNLIAAEYHQLGAHTAASAAFLSNFALWGEAGYFDKSAEVKPLLHLWSLGIEEQFYIFWPLILGAAWKYKFNFVKLLTVIGGLSFCVNILTTYSAPLAAFYFPLSRFWELLVGGGLAYASLYKPNYLTKFPNLQASLGFVLIFLGAWLLTDRAAFPGWWALLPTIGTWLCISAGPSAWVNRYALSNPVAVWIGKISYPLYLWHWPLLSFAWIGSDGPPTIPLRLGLLFLAFVLAAVTYYFIEYPLRAGRRNNLIVKLLCAGMVAVGSGGAFVYFTDGVISRSVNGNPAGFDYDVGSTDFEYSRCFLNESGRLPFESFCDGVPSSSAKKPLVLIWGDSHAHSLALGLSAQSGLGDFDLAQFTASACPPVIGFVVDARPRCQSINQSVAEKIKLLKPHTVIIAAFWYLYNGHEGYSELDFAKLAATVEYLKQQHIQNIIIVGQLPIFSIDQPKVANRVFVSNKTDRTFYRFNSAAVPVNEKIRSFAIENGVSFLSPMDVLCNSDGCLISTMRTKLVPLAWDYGHLTRAGAEFVFKAAVRNQTVSLP